jgi:hypothetical protein
MAGENEGGSLVAVTVASVRVGEASPRRRTCLVGKPPLAARQAMRRGYWAIKALLAKEAGRTLGPMGTRWYGRGGRPVFDP